MKHRTIKVMVLLLAVGALLFAGGSKESSAEPSDTMRAAMLMSGPINDGGWNTSAYEGLLKLRDELGFEIAYSELVPQTEHVNILRNYASRGYDIVFGHGFEYGESLLEVAEEFPNVNFYQIGGDVETDNVGSGVFASGEHAYLMGKLAAKFTSTNRIGFVGAMAIPTIELEVKVLRETIEIYNPEASFTVAYTGSWDDVVRGKEAALAQIANGVDVIIAIGDACDVGAIQAAEEEGVHVIGWSGDFHSLSPEVVLTSAVQSVPELIMMQGQMLMDGVWNAEHKVWGIPEGVMYLGGWSQAVPAELKEEIMSDLEEMKTGIVNRRISL